MSENKQADLMVDEAYRQLKRIASGLLHQETSTMTLSPTILVHEAYVRLSRQCVAQYKTHSHFLAIAATMMRRVLVDQARSRHRKKRGRNLVRVLFCDSIAMQPRCDADILVIDELLDELHRLDERQSRIVEMRFFAGMTVPEVADVLGLSTRTIENEWKMCRAWLRKRLEGYPKL